MSRLKMRIYIEDTDAGGIVYYVNYLKFMERARTEFMRTLGFGKTALWDELMFVVVSVEVEYKQSAMLDDEIEVTSNITNIGGAALQFEQKIFRDDELLCSGSIKVGCIKRATRKPVRMPSYLVSALENKRG